MDKLLSADGELALAQFCAYCGALTETDADYCRHCGEYIADQGPDRSALLARISRHARAIPVTKTEPTLARQFLRLVVLVFAAILVWFALVALFTQIAQH